MATLLESELEEIVDRQMRMGRFESRDEVIAAGLMLLDESLFVEMRDRHTTLKADVDAAIEQSRRGESRPFDREGTLRRARELYAQR